MLRRPAAPHRPVTVGPLASWRAALRALTVAALVTAPAASVGAQTLTFNGLASNDPSGVVFVNNCYREAGFQVSITGLACGTPNAFASYTPANGSYTGSPALFNNDETQPTASVDFTLVSGGTFNLNSIGLAPVVFPGLAMGVTFTGMRLVGGPVAPQTIMLTSGMSMMSNYALNGFTNLTSVRLTPLAPDFYVQFDNVAFSNVATSTVPEPSTYALMATGLAGLLTIARRRRARG